MWFSRKRKDISHKKHRHVSKSICKQQKQSILWLVINTESLYKYFTSLKGQTFLLWSNRFHIDHETTFEGAPLLGGLKLSLELKACVVFM